MVMSVDTRALRSLITVIELASFSRAADALGFTQSAVSQQVASLERDVGATLLVRRPVSTTPAGERFAEHARQILALLDAARADAMRLGQHDVDDRPVRLGLSPAADDWVPFSDMVGGAGATHLAVGPSRAIAEQLNVGALDLALVDGVAAPSDPLPLPYLTGTTVRVLLEAPLSVLLPTDHPFARRTGVELGALGAALWIDAPASACPTTSLAAVAREPLRLGTRYDGARRDTLHELVRVGRGIVCEPAGTPIRPGLVLVPLRTPRLTHRVELWWHEPDRPAVLDFAASLLGGQVQSSRVARSSPAETGTDE